MLVRDWKLLARSQQPPARPVAQNSKALGLLGRDWKLLGRGQQPPAGPLARGSKCATVAEKKPRRLQQSTAVEGARATGTRLRVCNCRQKHAQGPRATNRRREGFGRVRADLGVAKV